ncbi:MAG: DNA polymerase III subunit gamma/tau [Mariprofundaceae bacterium]
MPLMWTGGIQDALLFASGYGSGMSYKVLARRWRPQRFSDLVGQDVVVRTLQNAVSQKSMAHAYLLTGIRGVGKTTIARLMAMTINCEAEAIEPCGKCAACVGIGEGRALDVQEMDAASHTGVDDIREILDGVRYPPTTLRFKIYIIDEAHMLSKSAFNALLKTLEEPPEHVLFILATTESEKLPITVRSRCQRFDLRRLGTEEIANYLAHVLEHEKVSYEVEAVHEIAIAADGSVRDALSLTERVLAYAEHELTAVDVRSALGLIGKEPICALSDALFAGDAVQAMTLFRQLTVYTPRNILVSLGELWHQLACVIVDSTLLSYTPSSHLSAWFESLAHGLKSHSLDMRYQVLIRGLRDLAMTEERQGAEMLLLRLAGLEVLDPLNIPADRAAVVSTAVKAPVKERKEPKLKPAAVVTEPKKREEYRDDLVASEPDLPFAEPEKAKDRGYTSWMEALQAYLELKPGTGAMLEHVLCLEYGEKKVRLALDDHQQRAISVQDRALFQEWMGRDIYWEAREGHEGESVSEMRVQEAEKQYQQLCHEVNADPHIQKIVEKLGAKVVAVQMPGKQSQP